MFQPESVGKEVPFLILNDIAQAIVQVTLNTVGVQTEELLADSRVRAVEPATESAFNAQKYIFAEIFLLQIYIFLNKNCVLATVESINNQNKTLPSSL